MNDYSILQPLLLQAAGVLLVAFYQRHNVPAHVNLLISSAFVTVPVFWLTSLDDVGMLFLFDICVPLVMFRELWVHGFRFPRRAVTITVVVFLVPFLSFPLSYAFLDSSYFAFHEVLTFLFLYRALLICCAVAILMSVVNKMPLDGIAKLAGWQSILLLAWGALQYLGGVDLVVYERLKDVENVVDLKLSGEQQILFGFGFLGLFRGAVPQMVVVTLFWWMLLIERNKGSHWQGNWIFPAMALGAICVLGTLSRSGLIAVAVAYAYCLVTLSKRRILAIVVVAMTGLLGGFFLASSPVIELASELFLDRFDADQLMGQSGSGVTRIQSALALFGDLADDPWRWLAGLGGFNPIAAHDRYGVYGMHGDFLDVIARHGLIVGLIMSAVIFSFFLYGLKGLFGGSDKEKQLARAVVVLALGFGLLGLTQGVLMFSGAAGYLASAHSWMAIGVAVAMREKLDRKRKDLFRQKGFPYA
ncbi:MAG: hypothetical protein FD165_1168 [Gammaproteobacteria bacterium]|nr:MAG: hypothetical protein FD165_1168 [Gammaproteobacteria bacterium]TND07327.1 MAG: hypothetical protein FD120_65 [Gammaproteobacteria bacterium]